MFAVNVNNLLVYPPQLASRKQFIEYKLKLATRVGADGSSVATGVSPADRAALIAELTEVQANMEALIRQYERRFNEAYLRMTATGTGCLDSTPATPAAVGNALGGAYGAVPNTPTASSPQHQQQHHSLSFRDTKEPGSWAADTNTRASFSSGSGGGNGNGSGASRSHSIGGAGAGPGGAVGNPSYAKEGVHPSYSKTNTNTNTNTNTSSTSSAAANPSYSKESTPSYAKESTPSYSKEGSGASKSAFKSIPPVR